jgi:hypothetical protein
MTTSGRMKTRVDRLKKKIETKGSSLSADKKRILHKQLRRFQRARRKALVLEKRAAAGKKPETKPAEEKPAAAGSETATPA